jgi:parallel beta-helix repeat protein
MYTPGYFPSEMTPFRRLKVYRNNAVGIFIHRCHNIRVEDGLFSDNNMGIDLDRAEGIEVTNTKIIGQSPLYEALMARQPGVGPVCDRNQRVGIDLHTWQKVMDSLGAKISNVQISGFSPDDPTCTTPSSIRFDPFVSFGFFFALLLSPSP